MKKSIFLIFTAILCSVSAWAAYDLAAGQYVYFEKPADWSNVSLLLGHNSYSKGYNMTNITNTNLYYWKTDKWDDYTRYCFIDATGWGGEDKKPDDRKGYASHSTNVFTNQLIKYHLFTSSGSKSSHASDRKIAINRTQTIKVQLKDGSNWVDATMVPADLTASTYAMTDNSTAVSAASASLAKESAIVSATVSAAYSATVSLSCTNVLDGYTFLGWYDGTTQKSTSTTYTYNATEAKTITARFSKEPKHTVTVSYKCGSTDVKLSETLEVGEVSAQTVTAEKIKDYTFSGWTLGSGVQSADENANPISITTKASGEYTLTANYTYIEPVIKTIYCKMEHDWWYSDGAAISAYVWGDEEGEWKSAPGALMALALWETKVWKIDIDIARYPKVCFIRVKDDGSANWGAQTKDLEIPTDEKNLFTISNTEATWANKSKCDGAWSVYTPAPIPDRYLTGNAAGFGMTIDGEGNEQWSPNTIKMTWNDATQKFTHTVSGLEANKYYKFRITDGTWDGKWGYSNLKSAIENVFGAEDNNISFVLAADGDLTITFDGTYIELTTTSSFAAPVYTIVGDAAVTGCHWDVNSVENQMVQDATDKNQFTLVKTVTAVAGEYDYKAIRNYSYDWEVASGTKLEIEKDGTGTITYTLDVSTKKLTAVVSDWVEGSVAQEVTLVGIGEDKEFTEAADHKTTSVSVELKANSVYHFNIVANSIYYKNAGIMWRGNCTDWTFTSEGDKAHIITDLAGTYTFTWTYDGNKLSVKYPDGTNVPVPVFLAGGMNSWDRLATRLIPAADGKTASATVELERNVYNDFRMVVGTEDWTNTGEMKRNNSAGWTFVKVTEDNKDVNAGIVPDATGEYIFTWSYDDNKLSVTYPEETCTDCSSWYLCGSFNEWGLANEFTKVDDKTVTTTVTLEEGEYKFKVQDMTNPRDGKWWGNQGTMQRNSDGLTTGWTFEQKSGDDYNCTIVADITGDYIFTWNTDTKKLSVKYPTITITLTTGDNSTVIAANIGNTVNVVIERSFTANDGYYTLCVPFNMDPSVIGKAYSLGTITEHVAGEGININLEEEEYMLSAGVPYLVLPKANMSELVVENVTILSDIATGQNITNEERTMQIFFEGFYSAPGRTTNGTTEYYVGNNGYLYNGEVEIRGLSGLFTITDWEGNPLKVRARVVTREDEATGFENITNGENSTIKLIENGQLIIIRGGEKFNAQGQKL